MMRAKWCALTNGRQRNRVHRRQERARQFPQRRTSHVGFLADANGAGTVLVRVAQGEARLEAEDLRPFSLAPDQILQLWAIRPNAAPEALGVIAPDAKTEITLSAPAEQALSDVSEVAVSAQPSREGQPEAPALPYLSRGPLIKTW